MEKMMMLETLWISLTLGSTHLLSQRCFFQRQLDFLIFFPFENVSLLVQGASSVRTDWWGMTYQLVRTEEASVLRSEIF